MAPPDIDKLWQWFDDHAEHPIYIELGIDDPTHDNAVVTPIRLYTAIGRLQMTTEDAHGRGIAVIPLQGTDEGSRLFLDPERITALDIAEDWIRIGIHDAMFVLAQPVPKKV